MALFNTCTLFHKITNQKKVKFSEFRLNLAEMLLKHVVSSKRHTMKGRPPLSETPSRLIAKNWAHFPRHIPPTEKKLHPTKLCKVCTKHKKRRETTWECESCLIPLHVPECFKIFHTVLDY